MPLRKNREPNVDYEQVLVDFVKSGNPVLIPDKQRDTDRARWHQIADKHGFVNKIITVWRSIVLCGMHKKPIIGRKPLTDPYSQSYDSDYECDYECDPSDSDECISNCCHLDRHVQSKVRTVVIFNQNEGSKVKELDRSEIREHLVSLGIVTHNGPQDRYELKI